MQILRGFYLLNEFTCLFLTLIRIFTSRIFFIICLCIVITNASTFKKELLLQNPIICVQAFYELNCFEQMDLHQSVRQI